MSKYNKELGKAGEDMACAYLKEKGHRILCRNFSCKCGEIDIISEKLGYVIFTEVKTRRNKNLGSPAEAITHEKQKHILKTAQYFFKINDIENYDCRFDVIEIIFDDKGQEKYGCDISLFRHTENAFGEGGM